VLQLTCPGVPDLYQGAELWDLSLVDPDNRRPIDFELRRRMLQEILEEGTSVDVFEARVRNWHSGKIKMSVVHSLLELRRRSPELFAHGDYTPCEVVGPLAEHITAFARRHQGAVVIAVASRLLYSASGGEFDRAIDRSLWKGTRVKVPQVQTSNLQDVLTGRTFSPRGEIEIDAPWIVLHGGT
jgi:(1->4)-alpha-D-glucan 1-alpha-D-glucosylmutase